jgi:hypothetical protein
VVAAPHSGTPVDLVQTAGVAMAVIALCLLVGPVLARGPVWLHAWLSLPGSTPLSMYTLHICVLAAVADVPALLPLPGVGTLTQWFLLNIAIVIVVAVLWTSLVSRRGPLEAVMTTAARAVQRPLLRDPRTPAPPVSGPISAAPPPGPSAGPRR